jgi:type II secretion system protein H
MEVKNRQLSLRLRARSGFTLIETLMVMIVVGIVATMVMPSFAGMGTSARANGAATVVMSDLQRAFSTATKNKRPVRVTFNTTAKTITFTDRNTSTVIWTRNLSGSTANELAVGTLSVTPTSSNPLDIYPNGVASAAITVGVVIGSQTRRVAMTRVGHVRIT